MREVLKTIVATLLLSLLISGASLTKVVCVHLDTKVAHVEAIEILDQGNEIHIGLSSFIPPENGSVKVALKADPLPQKENLRGSVKNISELPHKHPFWKQPLILRTVRLIT